MGELDGKVAVITGAAFALPVAVVGWMAVMWSQFGLVLFDSDAWILGSLGAALVAAPTCVAVACVKLRSSRP